MKLLSEFKGDDALDLLADLIDPACEIIADREFLKAADARQIPLAVKIAIKNHKKAVTTILALLNEQDPETYQPDFIQLPGMIYQIFDDPELMAVFTPQSQKTSLDSGDATANTEGIVEV